MNGFMVSLYDSLLFIRSIFPDDEDVAMLCLSQMFCFLCLLAVLARMNQDEQERG